MRILSAGVAELFGNCAGGKYSVYPGRNNAERRARDYGNHCAWGPQLVSRCDVMRQQTTRWMVKAGQDPCSKKLQAIRSQIAVVAPPVGSYLPKVGPGATVGTM